MRTDRESGAIIGPSALLKHSAATIGDNESVRGCGTFNDPSTLLPPVVHKSNFGQQTAGYVIDR